MRFSTDCGTRRRLTIASVVGDQFFEGIDPSTPPECAQSSSDLLHQLAVRLHRSGLLPRFVLVGADKNGRGAAIPRDEDLLVSLRDAIHQATELGFGFGQGECFHWSESWPKLRFPGGPVKNVERADWAGRRCG